MIKFSEVCSYEELKKYLFDKANTLQHKVNGNTKYLCHYTNLDAAVSIIKNKAWYMGSPLDMNDGLELSHVTNDVWKKVFFASFMLEPVESIAMWSMYAQPWELGVMIRIPVEKVKGMVKNGTKIYSADKKNGHVNLNEEITSSKISFHAVAYSNMDSKKGDDPVVFMCGKEENERIVDNSSQAFPAGFIKDFAWTYENEFRLRIDVAEGIDCNAVLIELNDEFIDSMEIFSGPRFQGSLLDAARNRIDACFANERVHKSLFYRKLNWVYCDNCPRPQITEKG